ncbi:MAG: DUF4372 domain-containing protein [Terracidiphilus sp.]
MLFFAANGSCAKAHGILSTDEFYSRPRFPPRGHKLCSDSGLRGFSCWDQFLALAFAQLTFRENLRDVEVCLQAGPSHYHRGERGKV